jgi:hypothetical protein
VKVFFKELDILEGVFLLVRLCLQSKPMPLDFPDNGTVIPKGSFGIKALLYFYQR